MVAGFPADLLAKAGFIADSLERPEFAKKLEKDGFEEMPILGATGEEGPEPEVFAAPFVDVNDAEIALATGGDVEAKTVRAFFLKEREEFLVYEIVDFIFAA